MMKKFKVIGLIFLMVAFLVSGSMAARYEDLTVGKLKVEKSLDVAGLLKAVANTTGNVWYVDSAIGTNGGGNAGKTWDHPFDTVDYAIGKCTANNGDIVVVLPGHAESYSAANGFDADVAGITILGLGSGADMPEFTFADTDATVAVGAANVTFENLRFIPGISDIVIGIAVEAAGDHFTLKNCDFAVPSTATFEFLDVIDLATTVDYFKCLGNTYRDGASSACNHFIEAGTGTNPYMEIVGNDIQGSFAVSAIWSDAIDLNAYIADNVIMNDISGQHCIEFTTTASGMIVNNRLYGDTIGAILDPGSMFCSGNLASTAIDESALPIPAIGDSTDNYIGTDSNNNDAATTNVADNADGSVLERLEHVQADTDKLDAVTLSTTPVAASLATFLASGGTSLGTQLAASKSLVDAIGTNGTTVADTATGIAGMIGVNDNNNAMDTSTVVVNADGSVYERLETIQQWQEKTIAVSVDEVTQDILDIAGGPILIKAIVGVVTAQIGANATTCQLFIDRDDGAADTNLSTAVNIETDAVGTTYIFSNANPGVLTPLTPGNVGSTSLMMPWFVHEGMLEQVCSADPGGAAGDHITWYITYVPLESDVVVTAQ